MAFVARAKFARIALLLGVVATAVACRAQWPGTGRAGGAEKVARERAGADAAQLADRGRTARRGGSPRPDGVPHALTATLPKSRVGLGP